MKVYKDIYTNLQLKKSAVTMGTFDGLHLAHKSILNSLINLSKNYALASTVVTYWPHPRSVLQNISFPLLSSLDEKLDLLEKAGIDRVIILPFTHEFSQITSDEFINDILIGKIDTKKLVMGYNHRFGRNREGSFEYLSNSTNNLFEVVEISKQMIDETTISSTSIRDFLQIGEVENANKLLGYNYFISGEVVEGRKLGRTIGFPTANINISFASKLIPQKGVYAVKVYLNSDTVCYLGMLNIGFNPTVNGTNQTIEVHIFDFNENIYNQTIKVEFVERIRDEQKFSSVDRLKEQLSLDKLKSLSILN